MTISKITIDQDACIGDSICVNTEPKAFELNKNGKSKVKASWKKANEKSILSAAKACPVGAIKVFDQKGKQIK